MATSSEIAVLCSQAPVILPSVLQCDYSNLEREIHRFEEAGVQGFHLDVMDGNFVPNLSFGFPVIEAFRRVTELPLDVHLMISNPEKYVSRYVDAGADIVTVHAEVLEDPRPLLDEIRNLGALAGLAINPPTPVETIASAFNSCDLILTISVMPGFGGQVFDDLALEKLRWLRGEAPDAVILEVDGGVNEQTIADCVEAGASALVVGSAITGQADYTPCLAQLNTLARRGL